MSMMVIDPYRFATSSDTFIMPYRQDHLGWSSNDGTSGVTYTRTQGSGNIGGGYAGQNGAADADDGDYWDAFFNLAAGTYTFTVLYRANTTHGILELLLDGVSLGTIDTYNGSATNNNVSSISSVSVAADGNYTLRMKVNGKNASATDYLLAVQSVTATRTGA